MDTEMVASVQEWRQWLAEADDPDAVNITAVTTLKHAALWAAATKMGGQAALSRHLGVDQQSMSRWVRLRDCPPQSPTPHWPAERLAKLNDDLFAITGLSLDELFPQSLRDRTRFLSARKTFEKTVRVRTDALERYAIETERRMAGGEPWQELARLEHDGSREGVLEAAMHMLTERQRLVIKLRFGLYGEDPQTYNDIAHIMRVTRERVRQIECAAIKKLRECPFVMQHIAAVMSDHDD